MKETLHLLKQPVHPTLSGRYTSIFCEESADQEYGAPSYFQVRDKKTNCVVGEVYFQEGPVAETGLNGISNEDALIMVLERLEAFQKTDKACVENVTVMTYLKHAIAGLKRRSSMEGKSSSVLDK